MQREVEASFRWYLHLLAMRYSLHDRAGARASTRADGRALAPSGEAADDGAEHSASADNFWFSFSYGFLKPLGR